MKLGWGGGGISSRTKKHVLMNFFVKPTLTCRAKDIKSSREEKRLDQQGDEETESKMFKDVNLDI